jgi:isoleucyl-tRNA synthetase
LHHKHFVFARKACAQSITTQNAHQKLAKPNQTTPKQPTTKTKHSFWGTPIPIWVSDDYEEVVVVGSIAELEELSGKRVADLHRHFIDGITIPSKMGKGDLKRVDDVFDCWFESGSMPYGQLHYPFENR